MDHRFRWPNDSNLLIPTKSRLFITSRSIYYHVSFCLWHLDCIPWAERGNSSGVHEQINQVCPELKNGKVAKLEFRLKATGKMDGAAQIIGKGNCKFTEKIDITIGVKRDERNVDLAGNKWICPACSPPPTLLRLLHSAPLSLLSPASFPPLQPPPPLPLFHLLPS